MKCSPLFVPLSTPRCLWRGLGLRCLSRSRYSHSLCSSCLSFFTRFNGQSPRVCNRFSQLTPTCPFSLVSGKPDKLKIVNHAHPQRCLPQHKPAISNPYPPCGGTGFNDQTPSGQPRCEWGEGIANQIF